MNQSSEKQHSQLLHHPDTTNNNNDDNNNDHTTTTTPHIPLDNDNSTTPPTEQHSPEAAGATRGITRTIQSLTQRKIIGRLPVKKPPIIPPKQQLPTTTVPLTTLPKPTTKPPPPVRHLVRRPAGATGGGGNLTRRIGWRRGRVAKVSDRVSTGLDVLSTVSDESSSTTMMMMERKKGGGDFWSEQRLKRSLVITGGFVKNTILGTFVYETYERMIAFLAPPAQQQQHQHPSYPNDHHFENDAFARASLSHHYLSGAVAGVIHSLCNDIMESLTTSRSRIRPFYSSSSTLFATACHHMMAHSVLFGFYESVKRMLMRGLTMSGDWYDDWSRWYDSTAATTNHPPPLFQMEQQRAAAVEEKEGEGHTNHHDNDTTTIVSRLRRLSEDDMVPSLHFGAVFLAGGSAGSLQHIVSHYTQLGMLDVVNERATTTGVVVARRRESLLRVLSSSSRWSRPSIWGIVVAFPTTAIGFVAFEYGKELAKAAAVT